MTDTSWVVRPFPRPDAALRLFCLPFAGGNTGIFDGWEQALPDRVEVCAVQYPGRRERMQEPPIRRMSHLVTALVAGVRPLLDRPYLLFGNSLGSKIAFEVAHRLGRQGARMPERLVVSSSPAPPLADQAPDFSSMTDQQVMTELVRRGTLPAELANNSELQVTAAPVIRADYELAATYRYRDRGPLSVPIDTVSGADDPFVTEHAVRAWEAMTKAESTTTFVPGGHDLLYRPEDGLFDLLSAACDNVYAEVARSA